MSFARLFRLPRSRNAKLLGVAAVVLIATAVSLSLHRKPRVWAAAETPVAFWAWRNQTPAEADVRTAIQHTQARAIFLRAGQIDFEGGTPHRIRAVTGPLPSEVDLHLVYNATRSLLAQLEQVDEGALADAIATAYRVDIERAAREQARVVGLQIDIDVPTRLLSRYAKILRALRAQLKPGSQLSITGLPTWMESAELRATLQAVDFWIPQLYGAEIPDRSDRQVPISSPAAIARFVNGARDLDKPFYAGLAAYSYTLLFSSSGSLISLRGDMDPAMLAADSNLELIEQRPFPLPTQFVTSANGAGASGEWRYVYRARADGVTDGLAMHAGDLLVVDVPSAESLRLSARIVRELAGEKLLGICVFRLPAGDDPATLNVAQVATALADLQSTAEVAVRLRAEGQSGADAAAMASPGRQANPSNWILEVQNLGTANAIVGSVKIDSQTTAGLIQSLTPHGNASVEWLCLTAGAPTVPTPCSQRRASVIRFKPPTFSAGQTVIARLAIKPGPTSVIPIFIEMQTDNGQSYRLRRDVIVESSVKP
jgi:hypothetical protein